MPKKKIFKILGEEFNKMVVRFEVGTETANAIRELYSNLSTKLGLEELINEEAKKNSPRPMK